MALLTPPERRGHRLARRLALLAGLALASAGEAAAQLPAGDLAQQVKAAYLLNFTRYVDWPPSAFPGAQDPIHLCVVAPGGFDGVVRTAVDGRRSRGRLVRVLVPDVPSPASCHVAYLAGPGPEVTGWLTALAGTPTLTVGEGEGFLRRGGTIAFVEVEETIRFEIDRSAARRAGLQISSRVLSLATRLHGDGDRR